MFFFKKKITSFEIITLHLSGMRYARLYEIVCKGQTSKITEYSARFLDDEEQRIPMSSAFCPTDEIIEFLNKCNILRWDGFYGKHPRFLRDGTVFHFNAKVNDGKAVKASGSQNFPPHFHELRDFISTKLHGE